MSPNRNRLTHFTLLLLMLFMTHPSLALGYVVSLSGKPNPPQNGSNTVLVEIKDEKGMPIADASLIWKVYMPAMGSMPYMEELGEVVKKDAESGRYTIDYWLSMAGSWEITLTIEKDGQSVERFYALTTSIQGFKDKNQSASSASESPRSELNIGIRRLQQIGVRFGEAKKRSLEREVHAIGVLEADDKRRAEIVPRYDGYVEELLIARLGERVDRNQALATIYSPSLVAAQNEYLIALRSRGQSELLESTRDKLRNLGMNQTDIDRLVKENRVLEKVTLRSPIAGTVMQIGVSKGSSFRAGQVLHTVSDLSENFFVARVFQQDLQLIRQGQKALIELTGGDKIYEGNIDLIFPSIDQGTGTTNVRIRTSEKSAHFRPGLYATIRLPVALGEVLSVPSEAILYSGKNRYVFVDLGSGRLEAREVFLGRQSTEFTEILSGIKEGDRVVESGNFLLSSEAQLRSALPKWTMPHDVAHPHTPDNEGEAP